MTVLAAHRWASNADLLADCHQLGYLRDADHILDPTFGLGAWWKIWRPEKLTVCQRAADGTDFRRLDYPNGSFDAIAFDPPYVCPGGRKTSTIKEMHARYGMSEGGFEDPDFRTPEQLQEIINDGLGEMWRLVRPAASRRLGDGPNGVVVVKCKDYIWSGQYFAATHQVLTYALDLGFVLEDRLEHLGDPGPQPSVNRDGTVRRQVHSRRNLSTLFVLRRLG